MDVCLRVLKESNKSRFDSYSVRNSVLIISHIIFRDCRVHIFSDKLYTETSFTRVQQIFVTFSADWYKREEVWKNARIYLKSDVFAAVAVVDAKAPTDWTIIC